LSKRNWLALAASAGAISLTLLGVSASAGASTVKASQPGTGCFSASYPALQWHAAKCVTALARPLAPATHGGPATGHGLTVGNGHDYSADEASGLISKATGTFKDVSSNISEKGQIGGTGAEITNAFSLQLNSQFFTGSPACSGSSDPSDCEAWQQFVYAYDGCSNGVTDVSCIFMQYWLIDYDATCPSGWNTFTSEGSISCYTNSSAAEVSTVTAKDLGSVTFYGSAVKGGNDGVSLTIGSGKATLVTAPDSTIDLARAWHITEWGVFGDAGGGEAHFGASNTLEAQTVLKATSSAAPKCLKEGFTGETNNLNLAATPALGTVSSPTMASKQTDGTTGTASCAVKA
jgi:hypothetical protein